MSHLLERRGPVVTRSLVAEKRSTAYDKRLRLLRRGYRLLFTEGQCSYGLAYEGPFQHPRHIVLPRHCSVYTHRCISDETLLI